MNAKYTQSTVSLSIICACLVLGLAGLNCGSDKSTDTAEYAEVRVLVTTGAWQGTESLVQEGGPVPVDEIESFLLVVDRIILKSSADDDSAEAEEDSTEKVVVFDAVEQLAVDNEIDLVDLANLSDVLSSSEVPPDDYTRIRMEISNPRLRLIGDPAGEYRTTVSLTANGRLFANVDLAISPGETVYLRLVLDGIHLVETGGSDFVLTPQLGVEILPEL